MQKNGCLEKAAFGEETKINTQGTDHILLTS